MTAPGTPLRSSVSMRLPPTAAGVGAGAGGDPPVRSRRSMSAPHHRRSSSEDITEGFSWRIGVAHMISSQLDREIGFEQDAPLAPAASVGHDLHHMGLVASTVPGLVASAWGGSDDLLGSGRRTTPEAEEAGEPSEPYTFFGT